MRGVVSECGCRKRARVSLSGFRHIYVFKKDLKRFVYIYKCVFFHKSGTNK